MRAAITLDIDWAPDFVIDHVAGELVSRGVRATWYVTHDSPAVRRLRGHDGLFDLGIHPNFLPGSTHGAKSDEVLSHCMAIVPEAKSVRTHGLVQTSNLLEQIVKQTGIATDVSLFLPHAPHLQPVDYFWYGGARMLRIPYFWEDDFEMARPRPCWAVEELMGSDGGLKVFDFHPIHVYLNSPDLEPYRRLKGLGGLAGATPSSAARCAHHGIGTGTLFRDLVDFLGGRESLTISDIAARHRNGGAS